MEQKKFDVLCVGILVADVITKPVEKIPARGMLGLVDSIQLYSGGCAMNCCIDMAKIGADVGIIGMVGQDGFGSFLAGELVKYGVDITGLKRSPIYSSSASVVLVEPAGERTFIHSTGANGKFTDTDIDLSILDRSDNVFVSGTMLMPTFDGAPTARFLKECKRLGKTTFLDTAWDDTGSWMKKLGDALPYIDYFLPSIAEAIELTGGLTKPEEIAAFFFERGVSHMVIKLGSDGCYLQENRDKPGVYLPIYKNVKALDTTGAGDSFCAGFIYGITHGMSYTESGKFANAVGAHCVSAIGSSTGIKSYAEIKAFMDANPIQ